MVDGIDWEVLDTDIRERALVDDLRAALTRTQEDEGVCACGHEKSRHDFCGERCETCDCPDFAPAPRSPEQGACCAEARRAALEEAHDSVRSSLLEGAGELTILSRLRALAQEDGSHG